MCLYGSELTAFGSAGSAILRVAESGCNLEFGDANAKACFGFAAPSVQIDLRDKAQQQQVLKTVYAGIGWEVPGCWS
jgi:hypothetical protein